MMVKILLPLCTSLLGRGKYYISQMLPLVALFFTIQQVLAVDRMVVVAHYKENLAWLNNLQMPYTVISRTLTPGVNIFHEPNDLGREVNCYLRYIIDNYYNLPDQIAFVHGHRSSWHVNNQDELLNAANWTRPGYRSLLEDRKGSTYNPNFDPNSAMWLTMWDELMVSILGPYLKDEVVYYCCATFLVSCDAILLRSLDTYKYWYNWILTSQHSSKPSVAFLFEYSWHRIFGMSHKNPDVLAT